MTDKYEDFGQNFTFSYTDADSSKSSHHSYDEGVMWTTVLNDFVDYLSFVYGYNIKDKVRVQLPIYMRDGFDFPDEVGWHGEFFDLDEELNKD